MNRFQVAKLIRGLNSFSKIYLLADRSFFNPRGFFIKDKTDGYEDRRVETLTDEAVRNLYRNKDVWGPGDIAILITHTGSETVELNEASWYTLDAIASNVHVYYAAPALDDVPTREPMRLGRKLAGGTASKGFKGMKRLGAKSRF